MGRREKGLQGGVNTTCCRRPIGFIQGVHRAGDNGFEGLRATRDDLTLWCELPPDALLAKAGINGHPEPFLLVWGHVPVESFDKVVDPVPMTVVVREALNFLPNVGVFAPIVRVGASPQDAAKNVADSARLPVL